MRVSGTAGQESSLAAQEDELRRTSRTGIVKVYKDRASGLRENRNGAIRGWPGSSRCWLVTG
ncbi:recombinase family protein [Nonomuraea turcica]|uniref:recombinase family protein n=1 Tax=Nonomuraea sp. G32 TaxID=3067274 RepID=UPI0035304CB2